MAAAAAAAAAPAVPSTEAAETLAKEALHLPISAAAPIYETLLTAFPTAATFWTQYLTALIAAGSPDVKQTFSRCLLNCLHLPLWRCYLSFIRATTTNPQETLNAYHFTLDHLGTDIASGAVWMEYIQLLTSMQTPETAMQVRTTYQKAVLTPTALMDQLWRGYEGFENAVSRATAKVAVAEYQPKFNSARAVYRERRRLVDEIDWGMLAVPPDADNVKQNDQCAAWKRLLVFDRGNPQRIDVSASDKQVTLTYEQCLMYLYHFPDVWYEYATWVAGTGDVEAAVKVFQRAVKAVPESELLKYAFAELEESRGGVQAAKKVYESLLANNGNAASTLSHIQFIRFLRRNEGVEAARNYFVDARKSPSCTYHLYVAYAKIAYSVDKDPKLAHRIFEIGLKKFLHEPAYILEYADFLLRMNDDTNARALFERALSVLPAEESVEVWKQFVQFEYTYGDMTSIVKVEKRRKEALSKAGEDALETTLSDVVSRYSFMDLWPCSAKDLNHLARQQCLASSINKNADNSASLNGADIIHKGSVSGNMNIEKAVVLPDTSRMAKYNPGQTLGAQIPAVISSGNPIASVGGGNTKVVDEILKVLSPALVSFVRNMPAVEGPLPEADMVVAILLQSTIPTAKSVSSQPVPSSQHPSTSDLSGLSNTRLTPNGASRRDREYRKRKDLERQEDDHTMNSPKRPVQQDVFQLRQIQKSIGTNNSQTGSAGSGSRSGAVSGGSISVEQSLTKD